MDYKSHYDRLIERGQTRLLEGYSEQHHIIPRCMGGNDSPTNLVRLTAEEHYVAHQLLVKIYPDHPKLIFAAHRMTSSPHGHRNNNKLYGWIRRQAATASSKLNTGRKVSEETRNKLSQALSGRVFSAEHLQNMSESRKGNIPWNKGKTGIYSTETLNRMSEKKKGKSTWNKGKPGCFSDEALKKKSESMKGTIPWNKGIPRSDEQKQKQSKAMKGRPWSAARRAAHK